MTNQSTGCVYSSSIISLVRKERNMIFERFSIRKETMISYFFLSNSISFSKFISLKINLSQLLHPTQCSVDVSDWPHLILTCPNGTILNELPFPSTDIAVLREVTSFLARGESNTRGPFTSIPSNICWMSNLTVSFSSFTLRSTIRKFHIHIDTQFNI